MIFRAVIYAEDVVKDLLDDSYMPETSRSISDYGVFYTQKNFYK